LGTIARVRRALDAGLDIAGRKYVFLASGTSQAREHSCWFISENEHVTAEKVRATMGMEGIKERIVAKYAARMGLVSTWRLAFGCYGADGVQPFSTTRAVSLHVNIRKDRPDIVTNDKEKL
jgi:hypothetical protein